MEPETLTVPTDARLDATMRKVAAGEEPTADEERLAMLHSTGYAKATMTNVDGQLLVLPVVKELPTFEGSVMVALYPDADTAARLSVAGGIAPADMHITLAYIGKADQLEVRQLAALHAAVAEAAAWSQPLTGSLSGLGVFSPGEDGYPLWAAVDVPGLGAFRQSIVFELRDADVPYATDHDFTPHITLTYTDDWKAALPDIPDGPLTFDRVSVAIGGERADYLLGEALADYDDAELEVMASAGRRGSMAGRLAKVALLLARKLAPTVSADDTGPAMLKNAEQRFTLGPWYVPDSEDAHGEWSDADELQMALWGYVEAADRDIRLQHNREVVAGRWVEAMQWPHPVTVPMTLDGVTKDVEFPAGTVFLGVRWEPWAYELVKQGLIRGYSIGGTAQRVLVDMPGPDGEG